jgi:signal transduction histidine kinase
MSFAEDASASTATDFSTREHVSTTENRPEQRPDSSQLGTAVHSHSSQQEQANPASPSSKRSERRHSLSELQDSLLPATTKDLFARAADIMRRSNDMSGVMFMDASYAATGIPGSLPSDSGKRCKILGFATDEYSSLAGDVLPDDMTPHESNFKWVLEQYPRGYSLNCDGVDDGTWTENTTTSEQLPEFTSSVQPEHGLQTAVKDRAQHVIRVKTLIPNVKSALFLPLWDFERGRWFAGCFCWSTRSQRALHGRLDLPFLKAFGHSIMQQVARLDAMTTNQAKTTFMSSLSHELRTPLHGILGSAHLMRNSHLDSFQISMVNSITVCGRTLLETVEHLLDHAERPEPNQNYSSAVSYGENSISIACEKRNIETPPAETSDILKCNIGFVTEEVVETMIIGEAPFNIALDANDNGDTSVDPTSGHAIAKKRSRFIILDICDYESLGFRLSASSYGRVVMNLFGNALKFTDSGYVHISVRSEIHSESKGAIVLRISDSGVGMTPRFLEKAFEPFRKQNQHTSGTGVGLSVVKRILEDVGGQIDVTSQPSRGTNIVLRLPLERLTKEESHDIKINPLPAAMSGLKGRKTCILFAGSDPSDTPEKTLHKQTLQRYVEVLSATLSEVLKLDVYHTSIWDGSDDTEVVICPEVSFESLRIIQKNAAKAGRRCPAIVLVAMDILEAETLRSDARVTRTDSIIESVTQP